MRAKLIGGLIGATLLVPGIASAQEVDDCYVDPTAAECFDVGGTVEEPEASTNGGTNGVTEVESEASGVGGASPDAAEVDVAVLSNVLTADQLPRTGSEVLIGLGLGVTLLGAGTVALVASRRRRSTTA